MRLLVCAPGPTHSTYDVWRGLVAGLRANGHEVVPFSLHNRLRLAGRCLRLRWEEAGCPPEHEPNPGTVLFHASSEVVTFALLHQPDWVLFVASGMVHEKVYDMLRVAGVRTALLLTESPYEDERQARLAARVDLTFTNERTSADAYGWPYLAHAYDPVVHHPAPADPAVTAHDVVFVGTLWQERIDLFAEIDWTGIDLGLYGTAELFEDLANADKAARLAPYWHEGYVDNGRTIELYRAAKLGLNPHRTSTACKSDAPRIVGAESLNPRCYEQAATGAALLLTDRRAEARDVFGDAVPTFDGPGTLEASVRYWLAHETERQGRVRALREAVAHHTYAARAAQLTATLESFGRARTRAEGTASWQFCDSTARTPVSSFRSALPAR